MSLGHDAHGHRHGISLGHEGHDHSHGMVKESLRIAFALTAIILVASVVGGILANSLALLTDAGHIVTDLFALGLAWFAAVQAERPSNERKTFGYHRVGILAALLNALTLIVIVVFICWEAIQRLQYPEPVEPWIMFVAAALAIGVNLFIAFALRRDGHNLNVRAASLHVLSDVVASLGVIIAGGVILFTGWQIVDPILSIGIAVLVALGAFRILHETVDILLEAAPRTIAVAQVAEDMSRIEGVLAVHDLHVWSIANGMHALSAHVLIENVPSSDSAVILQRLTRVLNESYHILHTTIQFECDAHPGACCSKDLLYCQLAAVAHVHGGEHG
jgi:cobalt-zinc-cadmium efflux system protein